MTREEKERLYALLHDSDDDDTPKDDSVEASPKQKWSETQGYTFSEDDLPLIANIDTKLALLAREDRSGLSLRTAAPSNPSASSIDLSEQRIKEIDDRLGKLNAIRPEDEVPLAPEALRELISQCSAEVEQSANI